MMYLKLLGYCMSMIDPKQKNKQASSLGNNLASQIYYLSLLSKHKGPWNVNSSNTQGHSIQEEGQHE